MMESRGSIILIFKPSTGIFPITDKRMTRFIISLEDAKASMENFDLMLVKFL